MPSICKVLPILPENALYKACHITEFELKLEQKWLIESRLKRKKNLYENASAF